jgi:hypothetical protein
MGESTWGKYLENIIKIDLKETGCHNVQDRFQEFLNGRVHLGKVFGK